MTAVFSGFFFIHLHLWINGVDLLPDFVGFILIAAGVSGFLEESKRFGKARIWASVLAVYAGIVWLCSLFRITLSGNLFVFLSYLVAAADFYVRYLLILGIREVEERESRDMKTRRLFQAWKAYLIIWILTLVPVWSGGLWQILGTILAILDLAAVTVFLVFFYQTRKKFLEYRVIKSRQLPEELREM